MGPSPRRIGVAVLVCLAVLSAGCGTATKRTLTPAPPRTDLAIEERTETLVDPSRPTAAVGAVAASPVRTLPTLVLAPAIGQAGGPYPLIVFAHGNGGSNRGNPKLLRAMASAGYVVAAPTFPFGAGVAPDGQGADDYAEQPGDMSYVVSEMLRLNDDAASPLHGRIDPATIGAVGHSLGASTTLALAAHPCCYDQRLRAAVVLAGGELRYAGTGFWAGVGTPVLFVHGDADPVVPYASGQRAFDDARPPRFLLTVFGGDHIQPFTGDRQQEQAEVVTAAVLDFLDHYLKGAPSLDRLGVDATRDGVAKLDREP